MKKRTDKAPIDGHDPDPPVWGANLKRMEMRTRWGRRYGSGRPVIAPVTEQNVFRYFGTCIVIRRHRSHRNRKESKMTQSTVDAIQALLKADTTVTDEQAKSILRCCKGTNTRRHLINAREACTILACSRPTLRFLVKQGRLQQINFSSRRVRFDFDEVQRFANNGAQA